jgi:ribosomal protein S18 acetylase RimI-like enzyme
MQLRVARHTERLDEIAGFYRDGLGLVDVGGFQGHAGYDGVFLEVPGSGAHLEFTSGGEHEPPASHPESLLVLYVGDETAVRTIATRVDAEPVAAANPYWNDHAVTITDPDGFRVVLVPERWEAPGALAAGAVIAEHTGSRADRRPLFELAEDSPRQLDAYIDAGRLLVAVHQDETVGHLQLTETGRRAEVEIKNTAVAPRYQRRGVGRALMAAATALARDEGRTSLVVATASADTDNLRFYQRLGFRVRSIERDAFTAAAGYEPGLQVDGIELRDRIWLDLEVRDEQ